MTRDSLAKRKELTPRKRLLEKRSINSFLLRGIFKRREGHPFSKNEWGDLEKKPFCDQIEGGDPRKEGHSGGGERMGWFAIRGYLVEGPVD